MDTTKDDHGNSKLKRRRTSEDDGGRYHARNTHESVSHNRAGSDFVPVNPSSTPPITTFVSSRAHGHLRINYLAQQYNGNLPLISSEDTIPSILNILNNYSAVIDRHESLAGNMGARPLGPILLKRFERIFDGPPTVLSNSEVSEPISWLDVLEFARSRPDQFTLTQLNNGPRVCQFNTKQCRVQITEEDFFLVNSGIPQKLIPPQPIAEDEEKELGTLEIVERNISQITHLADQVAVRARQFNHRLRGRKQAILERRAAETAISHVGSLRAPSPSNVALVNGIPMGESHTGTSVITRQDGDMPSRESLGVSQSTYDELTKSLLTVSQKRAGADPHVSRMDSQDCNTRNRSGQDLDLGTQPCHTSILSSTNSKADSPSNSNYRSHSTDEDGLFKAEMVARLESLTKGGRIVPPCDRCRRLHMDCLKNLTACMGCTKKHAKCSWKEVKDYELRETYHAPLLAKERSHSRPLHHYEDEQNLQYSTNDLGSQREHRNMAYASSRGTMNGELRTEIARSLYDTR